MAGVGHLTSDNMFLAEQITLNNAKINELGDKKKFSGKWDFMKRRQGNFCKGKNYLVLTEMTSSGY